ncbi:MAG: ATP-dependent helicase HrpB [Thermodesulfobacteriota bacterium]
MEEKQHFEVHAVLPQLREVLGQSSAILTAPTGSGKTTGIAPHLLDLQWLTDKKIILLEPRRLAARTAAGRMAKLLGEKTGQTVGFRVRHEQQVSSATRIEVVTEGVLTRLIQADPGLTGVGLVIFDEFHERSIHADLGLALCLELAELRDDLRLLVMSATLETSALAKMMGGVPVLQGKGRAFPVERRYLAGGGDLYRIPADCAGGIGRAWQETEGDILVFLPGAAEIHRTARLIQPDYPEAEVLPLYGELPFGQQDRAVAPGTGRRRIILATAIAETSLTIAGIEAVVDSGWSRRSRFNSSRGMNRLETVRVSRASATQRAGRAGRLRPGICYRLWAEHENLNLPDSDPPEIVVTDLAPLVLELALWGVGDPAELKWLDLPRSGSVDEGRALLQRLGAVDEKGRITDAGKWMARMPLHPRLAHMILLAEKEGLGRTACLIAALLEERDIFKGRERGVDIAPRLSLMKDLDHGRQRESAGALVDMKVCRRVVSSAERYGRQLQRKKGERIRLEELGHLLLYAFPDRLAGLRPQSRSNYLLANGRGVELPGDGPLAASPYLVVPRLNDRGRVGRIQLCCAISRTELREFHHDLIEKERELHWIRGANRIEAREEERIGRIVLSSRPWPNPPQERVVSFLLARVAELGLDCLSWSKKVRQFQARVILTASMDSEQWPDLSDEALAADLSWLAPYCGNRNSINQLKEINLGSVFLGLLSWQQQQQVDRWAPTHLTVPSGSKRPLNYEVGQLPVLSVRLQELFGLEETPALCDGRVKLLIHILSPAGRPIQVTSDLRSFWESTYKEVKKELAGRYPKHHWPDDPYKAVATARCKPRKR